MRNDIGSPVRPRVPYVRAPGIAVGIDEELIGAVVEAFYARVRTDADLGPIFQRILDWPAHLARMCDFWSSVILITGAYKGDVIGQHLLLPGLTERHFGKMDRTVRGHDERALHAPAGRRVFAASGKNRGSHQGRPKKIGTGLTQTLQTVAAALQTMNRQHTELCADSVTG
ncbi:MAG: group III truncated hemoglobin [Bradyrhizobium sp.]|uniref:group III truncated hemoglobin n=1 Tax=Bradyrhizobium sp. TaxID=376 RepID=UPI002382A999|nr:group III truncated hemoglobin [Bradyrhizobium sp.]MDE2601189.1 group III truncated hemoglobin [Bradyrhizobium sp.]